MNNYLLDRISIATTSPIKVLFDESHAESWTISLEKAREVNPKNVNNCSYFDVAKMLRMNNYIVNRNTKCPITRDILKNCDIFSIIHPVNKKVCACLEGNPIFEKDEINSIKNWVFEGGALFLLYEYEVDKWLSNINELSNQFGIHFNNNVLLDSIHCIGTPSVVNITITDNSHPILKDLSSIIYYTGCTLSTKGDSHGILFSDHDSIPPLSPVIAVSEFGKGRVVAMGETDLFDSDRLKEADNSKLLVNIFKWLSSKIPIINCNQEIKLFNNKKVEIKRLIQNISSVKISDLIIKNQNFEDQQKNNELISLTADEKILLKDSIDPTPSFLGIKTIGEAIIKVIYDDKRISREFILNGAKIDFGTSSHSKPQIISTNFNDTQNNIALMPICPLNLGHCSLIKRISQRYRGARVFLDIPYKKSYLHFEKTIRNILTKHGLIPVAAKDRTLSSILLCNVCEEIQTCRFAIADISEFNPNIFYELGLIHALGKHCAILKFENSQNITDIQGLLYISYSNTDDIENKLTAWINANILT